MARNVAFKQADVLRAVKGASAGGMTIGRMEIDTSTGRIILFAKGEDDTPINPLDGWLKRHAGQPQGH